jgi:GPH family glycoside/pentoside/hexuronide:cation symporter
MTTSALQEERVPLASRIWISLADASVAILQSLVAAGALTYYFVNIRGLSTYYTGIVWLLFGIWNAVNDPLFGYISDRTKNKLGRRIPYIRYGAPLFILSFILFWLDIPGVNSQVGLFVQMLLALFLYDALYTAIATSLYIMPYEVAISNKARSSIYIWKIIFMVFTIVVPVAIEATIKPEVGDLAGISFFRWFMILFAIGMGLIIYFSTFFYKEKHYTQEDQQPGIVEALVQCFKNRSFVLFEVLSFTIIFVQTSLMQGLWYYFDEIDVSRVPLYVALAVGIVGGVFLWINRREPWGVKFSTRLFSLLFALGCFLIVLLGKNTIAATIGFLLFGLGFAGGMYLIPLMNGDVVDMDEHRTGLRREGMYAGVNSLITKPAISLAQWVLLTFMSAWGYDQTLGKGMQSASAETGILLGWALVPGILLFLSYVVLHWYPLDGQEWLNIKAKLAEVHKEKERKYLESQGYKFVE